MKRVTNEKIRVGNGDTLYTMARVAPDGKTHVVQRRLPNHENRSRIAYVLLQARRDLHEAMKPESERWFRTDDSLPTSGVLVEAEVYGAVVLKLSYSRGFWYDEEGRLTNYARPTRWRYLPEGGNG